MTIQFTSNFFLFVRHISKFRDGRLFLISLIFLTFIFFPFCHSNRAFAQVEPEQSISLTPEEQAWLRDHPDIQLGYLVAEPEVIANADGTYSGMQVDFLDALNRKLGIAIRLHIDAIPPLIAKAKAKKIDGILALHPEYADKLGLLKTQAYWPGYPAVFARKGETFEGPRDFKDKRVALHEGVHWTRELIRQYGRNTTIIEVKSGLEGLRSVEKGTVDFYLAASHRSYLINKYQLLDITVAYVFQDSPALFGIGVRSDWPQLVTIINKGLALFSEKEINDIIAHWSYLPPSPESIDLTQKEKEWLAQNHTVRVRVGDYPPNYFVKDGEPVGLTIDLLKEISKRSRINFHFVVPSPSFSQDIEGLINHTGPDILPSLQKNPERAEKILFTKPYVYSPRFIFTRDDTPFVTSLEELMGKTVAVEKNFLVHNWLADEYPDINLLLVNNTKEALKAVVSGKASAYVGPLRSTATMISRYGFRNLKATSPSSLPDAETSMAIRSDWPELLSILNKALDLISEPEKNAIINKWSTVKFDHGISRSDVMKWVFVIAVSVIVLIFLFIIWNRSLRKQVQVRTKELESSNKLLEIEVDERKVAETTLLEIKQQERTLIDAVQGSFFLIRANGTILVANQGLADHFGKQISDLIGTNAYDLFPEGPLKQLRMGYIDQVVMSGQTMTFKDERDGRFFEHRLFPLKDRSGKVEKLAVFANDISKDIVAQQRIDKSEQRFRATFEQAAVGMAHVALDGKFLRINKKFSDIVGYSHDEMLALTFQDITHPDDLAKDLDHVNELLSGKKNTFSMEKRYLRKDDAVVWVNLTVALIREENGKPDWFVSVIEDITDQKLIEEALRNNEQKFRGLMEQSPLSIVINSPDGRIEQVNQAFMEMWGISEEMLPDIIEKYSVLQDEEAKKRGVMPLIERAFDGEAVVLPVIEYNTPATIENLDLDNDTSEKRWVQVRFYPIKSDSGELKNVVAVEEDITARKLAELKAQEHKMKFKDLVEQSPIAFELYDLDGTLQQVNRAFERLWQIPRENVVGRYNVLESDQVRELGFLEYFEKAYAGEDVSPPDVQFDSSREAKAWGGGGQKRWVSSQLYPVKSSSGQITHVVLMHEDITEQKIAHGQVLAYQDRLRSLASELTLTEEKERRHLAAELHDHIGQTLAFTRIQVAQAQKNAHGEKLTGLLEEISQSLLKTIQDTKELVFDLSSPLLHELGLQAAIKQWLESHIAKKYGLEYELVSDRTKFYLSKDARFLLFRNVRELLNNVIRHAKASKIIVHLVHDEQELKISVGDNGVGFGEQELISAQYKIQKFGLFSVRERMEDMGGSMEIISETGKGCKVVLRLPLDENTEQGNV